MENFKTIVFNTILLTILFSIINILAYHALDGKELRQQNNSMDSVQYYKVLYYKEQIKVLKLRTQNLDMKEHCTYYANNPIIIE
jgi:hypothetical protein